MKNKESLEIITIQEFDKSKIKDLGKDTAIPNFEVTHFTQYPDGSKSGAYVSYAYTENKILHYFALMLEISMESKAKLDFKLNNNYLYIKETADIMLRHHNYFVNELEKQSTTFGLLKLRSKRK